MLTCSPTSRMSEPSATTSSSPTTPSGPTTALAGCRHSPSYQGLTCPRSLVLICPPDGGAYQTSTYRDIWRHTRARKGQDWPRADEVGSSSHNIEASAYGRFSLFRGFDSSRLTSGQTLCPIALNSWVES